jgi:uncharacterized membrane protein
MSIAQALTVSSRGGSRWLLLGSLALNLFFIGFAVAMALRGPPPPPRWSPDVFVRVDRLADTLPPADGKLLRGAFADHHAAIETAQNNYHAIRATIHQILRQDPFKVEDLRAAMAKTRAARQDFDRVIQGVFADVVPRLSSTARHEIADWRRPKGKTASKSR